MRAFVLAVVATATLVSFGTNVPAQDLSGIAFDESSRDDPLYSIPGLVTVSPNQYVYYCNKIWPFNQLFAYDMNNALFRYQELRKDPDSVIGGCDYLLSPDGSQYGQYGTLILTPMVHPLHAPHVPEYYWRNDSVPEVAILHRGQFAPGVYYFVVLAHPIIDNNIQLGMAYDLVSAIFGGQ